VAVCGALSRLTQRMLSPLGIYQWLGRAQKGRAEPNYSLRRHDEYEQVPQNAGSCCDLAGAHE